MAKAQVPAMVRDIRSTCEQRGIPVPSFDSLEPFYNLVCRPHPAVVKEVREYMSRKQETHGRAEWHGFHVRRGDLKKMLAKLVKDYSARDADRILRRDMKEALRRGQLLYVSTDTEDQYNIIKQWFTQHENRWIVFAAAHEHGWCSHEKYPISSKVRETSQFTFMCDVVALSECSHVHYANESTVKTLLQGVRGTPFKSFTPNGVPEPEALVKAWPCKQQGLKDFNGKKEFEQLLARAADRFWLLAMLPVTWTLPLNTKALTVLADVPETLVRDTYNAIAEIMRSRDDDCWHIKGSDCSGFLHQGTAMREVKQRFKDALEISYVQTSLGGVHSRSTPFLQSLLWYRMRPWSMSTHRQAFLSFQDSIFSLDLSCVTRKEQADIFSLSPMEPHHLVNWKSPPGRLPVGPVLQRQIVEVLPDNHWQGPVDFYEPEPLNMPQGEQRSAASTERPPLRRRHSRTTPLPSHGSGGTVRTGEVIDLTTDRGNDRRTRSRERSRADSPAPWQKKPRLHLTGASPGSGGQYSAA